MPEKTKRRGRTLGLVLMVVGIVLLLGAGGVYLYSLWEASVAGDAADAALASVLGEITEGNVSEMDAEDPGEEGPREMKVVWIDGVGYIGYLSVPSLGLELPVLSEWSYEWLEIGPCRYAGSLFTDDLVIAGHNYQRHFATLKWADPGTKVIFTDMDDNDYYFEILRIETVAPTAIDVMLGREGEKDWDMTLFTCTTGGAARAAIRCVRNEQPDEETD